MSNSRSRSSAARFINSCVFFTLMGMVYVGSGLTPSNTMSHVLSCSIKVARSSITVLARLIKSLTFTFVGNTHTGFSSGVSLKHHVTCSILFNQGGSVSRHVVHRFNVLLNNDLVLFLLNFLFLHFAFLFHSFNEFRHVDRVTRLYLCNMRCSSVGLVIRADLLVKR